MRDSDHSPINKINLLTNLIKKTINSHKVYGNDDKNNFRISVNNDQSNSESTDKPVYNM